jgi:hypothetical protein
MFNFCISNIFMIKWEKNIINLTKMVPLNDFPEKKSLSDLREIEKKLTTEKRIRLF